MNNKMIVSVSPHIRAPHSTTVSEGEREFSAIAVVGGMEGRTDRPCAPCGVCRQALREFCDPESFLVLLGYDDGYDEYTLGELLPESFGPENVT